MENIAQYYVFTTYLKCIEMDDDVLLVLCSRPTYNI